MKARFAMTVERNRVNREKLADDSGGFQSSGGREWLKLVDGTNIVRVLPPWNKEGRFFWTIGYHSAGFREERVTCPNVTFKETWCPICARASKVKDTLGREAARLFEPQRRGLLNALHLGVYSERDRATKWRKEDDIGIVRIWEAPPSIINPIINMVTEDEDDLILDPVAGHNIKVRKFKKGEKTNYEVQPDLKPSDLKKYGIDAAEVLANLHDLAEAGKRVSKDDVLAVMEDLLRKAEDMSSGGGGGDEPRRGRRDEEERRPARRGLDDDDAPPPRRGREDDDAPPPRRREPAQEDDEVVRPRRARDELDDGAPAPRRREEAPPARRPREPELDDDVPPPRRSSRANDELDRVVKPGRGEQPSFDDPELETIPFD